MTESFDPYYRWLGISTKERPPNHYRLLGLELFESDLQVIESIASRHIDYLQEINDGPHIRQSQQLLNELTAARRCLLDPASKKAYDRELRTKIGRQRKPPKKKAGPPQPPPAETKVVAPPPVKSQPPAHPQAGPPPASQKRSAAAAPVASSQAVHRMRPRRTSRPRGLPLLAAGGSVAVLVLVAIAVWWTAGPTADEQPVAGAANNTEEEEPPADSSNQPSDFQQQRPDDAQADSPDHQPAGLSPAMPDVPDTLAGEGTVPFSGLAPDANDSELAADAQRDKRIPRGGLQLWLDAADAQTLDLVSEQTLRGWTDKSDNRRKASAQRAALRPSLVPDVLGGRPVARFSGAQWIEISGTSSLLEKSTNYTFVFVARGAVGTLLSKGTGETDAGFSMSDGVASLLAGNRHLDATASVETEFRIRSVVADETSVRWFVDGNPNRRYERAHEISTTNILRIGCTYLNGQGAESLFQGELAELLVYDRTLDEEQRTAVEECLREKWFRGEAAPFPFGLPEPPLAATDDAAADIASDDQDRPAEPMETVAEAESDAPSTDPRPHDSRFVVLKPVAMTASAGSDLHLRDDGAVLCDDKASGEETFRIQVESTIPGITAILLEALPDDSLPGKGPGHGLAGSFSLAEFSVTAEPRDQSQPAQSVSFSRVTSEDASGMERLLDGDTKTSWTVRRRGETTRIVFFPSSPIGNESGAILAFTLVNRDALGCFRILATSAANPRILPVNDQPAAGGGDGTLVLRVNLGGTVWQEPGGGKWLASKEFAGEDFGHEGGRRVKAEGVKHPVYGTAQQSITAFRAVVPNGVYEVHLVFSEHWTTDPARRIFSAFIEQHPVLQPVNLFRAPGLGGPYIHKITNVRVADGRLDIGFKKAGEDTTTILNGVIIRQTH